MCHVRTGQRVSLAVATIYKYSVLPCLLVHFPDSDAIAYVVECGIGQTYGMAVVYFPVPTEVGKVVFCFKEPGSIFLIVPYRRCL